MKLMIIKEKKSSSDFLSGFFRMFFNTGCYEDCTVMFTKEMLKRECPHFVYLKLFQPVDGDNDVMTMLSSMDVNTRLRVFIVNMKQAKKNLRESGKNFILPGRTHKLDTP